MDLIYRFDPFQPITSQKVNSPQAARTELQEGNRRFVEITTRMQQRVLGGDAGEPMVIPINPVSLGLPLLQGMALAQSPFALVLGCSDARVPTEAIFDQAFNNLFVVRIAGNVLGTECLGSIDYAVKHLGESLKVIVVLGHSGCGAVTAAVDGYLSPTSFVDIAFTHSLRSLVDRIQIAVRGAAQSLKQAGAVASTSHEDYRAMLTEAAVYLNAAVTAYDLAREVRSLGNTTLPIVYGVYDLTDLHVRALPWNAEADARGETAFADAPESAAAFEQLGQQIAQRLLSRPDDSRGQTSINWSLVGGKP